jgi:hypothetical protein
MKYCQGPLCHTYDTKDRKRGPKGNKVNQTRRRSSFYNLQGNACSLQCANDWFDTYGERAVDYFGRVTQPIQLTEDNAWRQVWNPNRYDDNYRARPDQPQYIERNMITGAERNIVNN